MSKEKIKDEALKQLFKLKFEQLNRVRDTFNFTNPITFEVIWLFSHNFERMYADERMVLILYNSYAEFQTRESREKLFDDMKTWAAENGYSYEQVFK